MTRSIRGGGGEGGGGDSETNRVTIVFTNNDGHNLCPFCTRTDVSSEIAHNYINIVLNGSCHSGPEFAIENKHIQ